MDLKEQRAEKLANARTIVDGAKALGRDLTEQESTTVSALVDECNALDAKIKKVDESQAVVAELGRMGRLLHGDGDDEPGVKRRMDVADLTDTPRVVGQFMKSARQTAEYHGVQGKSLVPSGVITVAGQVSDLVTLTQIPNLILPLIPVQTIAFPTFVYLAQTVRTNAAAPVALGAVKPTSVLSLAQVNGQTETIAHLSEAIQNQWLADEQQLQTFVRDEMTYGLVRALEAQCLNGTGTSPQLRGILQTSGLGTTAFAVDKLATIRAALTSLEVLGEAPNAIVMHPADWAAVEQLRDLQSRFVLTDLPQASPKRELFGLPVVSSVGMAVGTALVGDFTKATLFMRQGITFDWGAGSLEFSKNQIIFRAELRAGLAVERPGAFNKVTLA